MKITVEIPNAKVIPTRWCPEGVVGISIPQDPAVEFASDYTIFVREDWIVKQEPDETS